MDADPRAVIERLQETINAHDPGASLQLFADGARLTSARGRVLDLDGLQRLMLSSLSSFPDLTVRVVRWIVEGDVVVTEEVMEGTHQGEFAGLAPTGKAVRLPMVHVSRVVDGQIVERSSYQDTAGIVRQLQAT